LLLDNWWGLVGGARKQKGRKPLFPPPRSLVLQSLQTLRQIYFISM
jgi:hypothetical protein